MMKGQLISVAVLALAGITGAQAQGYPTRSATLIVPFAAGGPADITGRIVADIYSRALGQQFVVENVAGAGGSTGTARVARANPDGYTLGLGHVGTHAAAVALIPNLSYKPDVDFEPVGLIALQPVILTVRKGFPANNLREFVAYAKANESKLNMAHAGVGSVSYTFCVMLNHEIGIKPTLVPFTGTAPALNAMLGEQVDYVCDPILGPLPHIRAGTLKAMAIGTSKRHPALPDLPTSAEGGLPNFQAAPFYAMFAPKGTPQDVLDKLSAALDKGLDDETVRKRLIDLGAEIAEKKDRGPKPLAALVKSEMARLTPILQSAAK
jgi:tripartite-type tricarboxylate transporter receptor subunit TctC